VQVIAWRAKRVQSSADFGRRQQTFREKLTFERIGLPGKKFDGVQHGATWFAFFAQKMGLSHLSDGRPGAAPTHARNISGSWRDADRAIS
jgi:hypothetical protein